MNHRYDTIDHCWNRGSILLIRHHHISGFDIKWNSESWYWGNRPPEI